MRLFLLAAVCLRLISFPVGAHADAPKAPYVPEQTRVALLPVVNASTAKTPSDAAVTSARISLGRQIVGRGFKVVPTATVTAALDSLKLTLMDQTPRTPEALSKVGDATHARLVVFVLVTQTGTHAAVTAWVLDTKTHTYCVNGKVGSGQGADAAEAARNAVEAALAEFLKPYELYDC